MAFGYLHSPGGGGVGEFIVLTLGLVEYHLCCFISSSVKFISDCVTRSVLLASAARSSPPHHGNDHHLAGDACVDGGFVNFCTSGPTRSAE